MGMDENLQGYLSRPNALGVFSDWPLCYKLKLEPFFKPPVQIKPQANAASKMTWGESSANT